MCRRLNGIMFFETIVQKGGCRFVIPSNPSVIFSLFGSLEQLHRQENNGTRRKYAYSCLCFDSSLLHDHPIVSFKILKTTPIVSDTTDGNTETPWGSFKISSVEISTRTKSTIAATGYFLLARRNGPALPLSLSQHAYRRTRPVEADIDVQNRIHSTLSIPLPPCGDWVTWPQPSPSFRCPTP